MFKNKEYAREYGIKRRERQNREEPWYKSFKCAKSRCNNPKMHNFHRYGGRGIKFLMSKKDMEMLWYRDYADLMEHPTIDRIDPDGDYEVNNCRFLELSENSRIANERRVRQFDKKGNFLAEYDSIVKASIATGVTERNISNACNGWSKTAGGFLWNNKI